MIEFINTHMDELFLVASLVVGWIIGSTTAKSILRKGSRRQ